MTLHARLAAAVTKEEEREALILTVSHVWPNVTMGHDDFQKRAPAHSILNGPRPGWIGVALLMVPEDWTQGRLSWPAYDGDKLMGNAKAEIHSQYSSGGGPREIAYAALLSCALALAALRARESRGG